MTDDRSAELTAEAREIWEFTSAGWIRNAHLVDRWSEPVKQWLLEHLDPQPGETFLELAAGAGDTGFEVAARLGTGRLISTDIAPQMVDAARRRAEERGIANAEFRLMDAQRIELEDGSVDGVIHRFGPMLLPDPAASLAEVRRVLRPGGRYGAVVWGAPDDNPWLVIQGMSLVMNGIEPPGGGDLDAPGAIFSLADPEKLRGLVAGAGFEEVTVEAVDQVMDAADFDELWKLPAEISGPIAVILRDLEPDRLEAFKKTFKEAAETFRQDAGYRMPARAICVFAR